MKTLKLSGLLALTILCSSCVGISDFLDSLFNHDPTYVNYCLCFSFHDTTGNDLVKGIEMDANPYYVKDSLYTLDIIVSEPCTNWDNKIYNAPARYGFIPDVNRPKLAYFKNDNGYSSLGSCLSISKKDCTEQKKLTYKLKLPYVFGDDAIHEIITYWDVPKRNRDEYGKCTHIEFESSVITPNSTGDTSIATIIWEGRKNNE